MEVWYLISIFSFFFIENLMSYYDSCYSLYITVFYVILETFKNFNFFSKSYKGINLFTEKGSYCIKGVAAITGIAYFFPQKVSTR